MSAKEEFIDLYTANIRREGADALLDYLENKSDFFTAPASARFHGAYAGGLCEHSINVYHCLAEYLARERVQELYGLEYPAESVAVAALLHDLCKICLLYTSRSPRQPRSAGRQCGPLLKQAGRRNAGERRRLSPAFCWTGLTFLTKNGIVAPT